ncbi:MAG: TfoX/Sxy family protein [Proteobacteria bacterium]|nr:TfoX/Sxy family protein [Pseudomonadota bacterium]MBS0461915.1 TfoX/Sxy family protein [Pseudomonadota bacterium]
MAYSEVLASRIRAILAESTGISEKRMFGGLCFLKDGHMFVGLTAKDLMARVGKDAYAASLARRHVREMDFTGKPMAGYVFVNEKGLAKDAELEFWVRHCEQFATTLPPKTKKLTPR